MKEITCPDLKSIFTEPVGYHGIAWVTIEENWFTTDVGIPQAMMQFLENVVDYIISHRKTECRVGCCYVRVVDAGQPENYMSWHVDNQDGGLRFTTSVSTDDVPVNLLFPKTIFDVGVPVKDTDWQDAYQVPNNRIASFTTEVHGVRPQFPREGHRTANFFVTFYDSKEKADLYTTNNTATSGHQALPRLAGR